MDRRTFIAFLSAPVFAQLLAACGDDDDANGGDAETEETLLRADIARAAGGDPAAAVRVVNSFGTDLYGWLTRDAGNIVISPASLAILERFGRLLRLELDLSRVRRTADRWREQVDQVAAGDDDIQSYVTRLEARYDEDVDDEDDEDDEAEEDWGDELPTGDEIAHELERYLRDQRGQQGD